MSKKEMSKEILKIKKSVADQVDKIILSEEIGKVFEWRKWAKEIPAINFPSEWGVQIIPPFAGAVVRFVVNKGSASVSVYLDCYENLGYFGEPHWEIYPDKNDNNLRFAMNDTKKMIEAICKSLRAQLPSERRKCTT